jgi:hypothetical protein
MTLKGKKNHYNVKLLRGYGVSISLKANRVYLKDGLIRLRVWLKRKSGLLLKFLMNE